MLKVFFAKSLVLLVTQSPWTVTPAMAAKWHATLNLTCFWESTFLVSKLYTHLQRDEQHISLLGAGLDNGKFTNKHFHIFQNSGVWFNMKTTYCQYRDAHKMRQLWDFLMFIMGIPILVRWHLYVESVAWIIYKSICTLVPYNKIFLVLLLQCNNWYILIRVCSNCVCVYIFAETYISHK